MKIRNLILQVKDVFIMPFKLDVVAMAMPIPPRAAEGWVQGIHSSVPHLNLKRTPFGNFSFTIFSHQHSPLLWRERCFSKGKISFFLEKMESRSFWVVPFVFFAFISPVFSLDKCTQVS